LVQLALPVRFARQARAIGTQIGTQFPEAKSILNELREHYCSAERLYVRKGCELCWVLRNECDYCSGSKLRIGCFSPAASRLRRLSQQSSFS